MHSIHLCLLVFQVGDSVKLGQIRQLSLWFRSLRANPFQINRRARFSGGINQVMDEIIMKSIFCEGYLEKVSPEKRARILMRCNENKKMRDIQ